MFYQSGTSWNVLVISILDASPLGNRKQEDYQESKKMSKPITKISHTGDTESLDVCFTCYESLWRFGDVCYIIKMLMFKWVHY